MDITLFIAGNVCPEKEEEICTRICPERIERVQPDKKSEMAVLADKKAEMPALWLGADGLALAGRGMLLRCDLSDYARRALPQNLKNELLFRACRLKDKKDSLKISDATAGLGEDSFVLASAGYEVDMYEYDPVIAALLADALERAVKDPLLEPATSRMHLHTGDSTRLLSAGADVVYLDPMFPAKKKHALTGKKMQILQLLERPCDNEAGLLEAALAAGPEKIVIKRPLKGPFLAGRKPDYSLEGKTIRYDVLRPGL